MKDLPDQMNLYRKTLDRCTVSDKKAQNILDGVVARKDKEQNNEPDRKKKPYRRYLQVVIAACAVLVIVAVAVQFSQHGNLLGIVIEGNSQSSASGEVNPSTPSSSDDRSESKPALNGEYHWNDVHSEGDTMMYKDPNAVPREVSFSELCGILGYDPTPTYIPQGFAVTSQKVSTFYVNPDGSWADYYSFFALGYTKGQDDITIYVVPAGVEVYANNDVPLNNQVFQKSTFDGFEAILMKNNPTPEEIKADQQDGISSLDLSAVFQIRGVNYYAYTRGNVPTEEFLKVLQSLY